MSPKYEQQIKDLTQWFKEKLSILPPVSITPEERKRGTDSLKEPYSSLVKEAFTEWLEKRNYELSCNQMCVAFFSAI